MIEGRTAKTTSMLADLERELHALANPERAQSLRGFFKTAPGQYGEGDSFLGIRVPQLRAIARRYRNLLLDDALLLLRSSWHEARLLALLIMVEQYRRGSEAERETVHRAYLGNTRYINNWDLVDASAEHIVGAHVHPTDPTLLDRLARSESLWERRLAVIATFHWIKRGEFRPTLGIARLLLADSHDLIHKAVGWMLREVGKRNSEVEEAFLRENYRKMPRTMLRYAIERFPEPLRQQYLRGEV